MKFAIYAPDAKIRADERCIKLIEDLGSDQIYFVSSGTDISTDTDMVLSLGGDGTYLSISDDVAKLQIPIMGVNFGRLGFLSEYRPEDVAEAVLHGSYVIEDREMLVSSAGGGEPQYSLNEVTVMRIGTAMVGVDVKVNGTALPTYWADGLIVATSSGSTAYSLSVGGPICTPDSKVLIISPISPHNLNVRPLIVPSSSSIELGIRSRDPQVMLTRDNRSEPMGRDTGVRIEVAQFSLKRVRLSKSSFIEALKSKLFWGEDVRNGV